MGSHSSSLPGEHGSGEARQHYRSASTQRWRAEWLPVTRIDAASRGTKLPARAVGVSLGGTFIATDVLLPVGSDLHVWLHPPNPSPMGPSSLRLLARVRWVNESSGTMPRGFGVAFRALTAADEIALHSSFLRAAKVV